MSYFYVYLTPTLPLDYGNKSIRIVFYDRNFIYKYVYKSPWKSVKECGTKAHIRLDDYIQGWFGLLRDL